MSIAKKGLRKININGENFYWKIRKKISHNESHNIEYAIPIQHEDEGQLLFIYVGFCRSYGYQEKTVENITPLIVKEKIIEAIELGWNYLEKGDPISVVSGKLIPKSKY